MFPKADTATDGYKLSHGFLYPRGTTKVYSNLTPRSDKHYLKNASHFYKGELIWVGIQGAIMELLTLWDDFFTTPRDIALNRYAYRLQGYLGGFYPAYAAMDALHTLGYLPIEIKSLEEGSRVSMGVPVFTVTNTLPEFSWLVNYLETPLSSMTWKMATAATVASEYRAICEHYAIETGADIGFVNFQMHDFSSRGMSGVEDSGRTGMAHLCFFMGSDTLLAIDYVDAFYAGGNGVVAVSIPATEHAVVTSNIHNNIALDPSLSLLEAEQQFLIELITEKFPTGMVASVMDSYDFWGVVTEVLPSIKDLIMAREDSPATPAKLVVRPDSGDPVDVICGLPRVLTKYSLAEYKTGERLITADITYLRTAPKGLLCQDPAGVFFTVHASDNLKVFLFEEVDPSPELKGAVQCLWETFGGTVNDMGFKQLDSHIGLIYGDSITPLRAEEILHRLMEQGFASSNVVLGAGSMSYQYHTRDTFGFAVKATHIEVEGRSIDIYKQPKTDSKKASAKGLLFVGEEDGALFLEDSVTHAREASDANMLQPIMRDGKWLKLTDLGLIRTKLGWV